MRRDQLEHIVRAAAEVCGDTDIVVVGSQAILGSHESPPQSMLASRDADVYPRNYPDRAELIEGALGEESQFDSTYGYYAHAVGPETAKGPSGWAERLVELRTPGTGPATGWCMEPHDLVLSKCVAGRERDWAYASEALTHDVVDRGELLSRIPALPADAQRQEAVRRHLEAL